jgi:hypothetical protein
MSGAAGQRNPHILLVEGGFDVVQVRVLAEVRWSEVSRIETYKLDLVTTDCICLSFEFRDGRPPVQISEEWAGFADLFQPMSLAFPSILRDWYFEVMLPAFETNHRVLYEAG